MKKLNLLAGVAILAMGIAFTSCDSKKSMGSVKLTSEVDSVSYMIGQNQGAQFKKQFESQSTSWPIKGNIDAYVAGMIAGINNADDTLYLGKNMQEAGEFVNGFFQKATQKAADENKAEAEKFLNENKTKSGVITTESGLQYQVITEGTGPKPKPENTVKVHYTGKYLDGTVFDSSVERGQPAEFPLNGVIPGFSEGVQLMPVGSKYIIWIPVELGYGTSRQEIKPNSLLIFEVELLDIVKTPAQ